MTFAEIADAVQMAGYPDATIEELRKELFERYPHLQADAFANAMSTLPDDPEVPQEWADEVLVRLNIPPEACPR